jgi:hypothetical protein
VKKQPKQLVNSTYERRENDSYLTDHWVTRALLRHLSYRPKKDHFYDPCAGRGDILAAIRAHLPGPVYVSGADIDPPKKRFKMSICKTDFLDPGTRLHHDADIIVTNPPFGDLAYKCLVQALSSESAHTVAFLLRSAWNTSPGRNGVRTRLFDNKSGGFVSAWNKNAGPFRFAYEIVLTERPLWDWWYVTDEERIEQDLNKPFHSYSWFVWKRGWRGPSTQFWEGHDGKGRVKL